jgi:bifunctional non-homologous end joining protein LigD
VREGFALSKRGPKKLRGLVAKTGLETYWKMRDFARTPEPRGEVAERDGRRFVVQEHHASKLHFDFRLEMGGVLKSWSIPRGPSLDPAERRLAVETEDHPVEYADFEGLIPEGEYGAGEHMKWDEGTYKLAGGGDALEQFEAGRIAFELKGRKLRGAFSLLRMNRGDGQWLLIKKSDEHAEPGWVLKLRKPIDGRDTVEGKSRPARAKKEPVRRTSTKAKAGPAVPVEEALKAKRLEGDVSVRVGRAVVPLTHLERVYWPAEGYTKGDLVRYYHEVAEHILPYLKGRPLIMKRYPSGIEGQSFHQHDVDEAPAFVPTARLEVEDGGGHEVDYVVGGDRATLLYMANLGAVERHPWHSRVKDLERPDWFVFDLDPSEGVEFETICALAVAVREVLSRLGLDSYPKTSGSRGIHVYVPAKPAYDYGRIAKLAEQVATVVARENAEVATVERAIRKRGAGRIYVDHMQNARGKSVVAPYSVRPKPAAPVSAPLEWGEVERAKIRPRDFNIKNVLARLKRKGDLFAPVLEKGQRLEAAFEGAQALLAETRRRAKA